MLNRLLFFLALAPLALLGGCGPLTFTVGTTPEDMALEPKIVHREVALGGDRIAIIDISGLIHDGRKKNLLDQAENPLGVLQEKLEEARRDEKVKAVILRINSPGGTVTASDAAYREVKRFRAETGKPVVAQIMDVGASGGYYLACSADRIVAFPSSVTGSIGVILQTVSFRPALNRLGIEPDAITSGPNKEAGSPLSTLTAGQRETLQELVNEFYAHFRQVVRERRPLIPAQEFDRVTDGRVFSGEAAQKLGMVDQLGDIYDSARLAKQLAGLERANLVLYHRRLVYVGAPYAASGVGPAVGTQVNLAQVNLPDLVGDMGLGFCYLWQPQAP